MRTALAKHDIRAGDVARTINGQAIEGIGTLRSAIKEAVAQGASEVTLVLRRGTALIELQIPTPPEGVVGIALEEQYEEPVFQ